MLVIQRSVLRIVREYRRFLSRRWPLAYRNLSIMTSST